MMQRELNNPFFMSLARVQALSGALARAGSRIPRPGAALPASLHNSLRWKGIGGVNHAGPQAGDRCA